MKFNANEIYTAGYELEQLAITAIKGRIRVTEKEARKVIAKGIQFICELTSSKRKAVLFNNPEVTERAVQGLKEGQWLK